MQAPSKMDENLKHVVGTACRPRVFQIAIFKGFPNIPHMPPAAGHSAGTNEATMATTPENAPHWHETGRPREICEPNPPTLVLRRGYSSMRSHPH